MNFVDYDTVFLKRDISPVDVNISFKLLQRVVQLGVNKHEFTNQTLFLQITYLQFLSFIDSRLVITNIKMSFHIKQLISFSLFRHFRVASI